MIDFYNAFISYKHAPLDISIAEHIQKKLEHFHVPHKLKSKLKHQKITRIFRDKDELPITSDLTETITEALEKAEYLIVICSTNTSQSMWVKREIATFLKFHSADKILTVLCDGEPEEVIPAEILSTQKTFVDAAGNTQTVTVPVEPLSCDYRMSKSKADREELPRLASALLGCSYDELQRRRRQYRIRRAAAIVAAAFVGVVAFGAYMSYKNRQIDRSYIESLRSRSVYLANESKQLLSDGKRTDALQLALAALPTDTESKMPVTGIAIRAITDATGAYKSNHGLSYEPIWNYKTDHPIKKLIINDSREYIAAYDKNGNVYCWNTLSHDSVLKNQNGLQPTDISFMDNDSLMVIYEHRVEAYNVQSGKLMWGYDVSDVIYLTSNVSYAANSVFVSIGEGKIVRLSAKDGSEKETYAMNADDFLKTVDKVAVSPDGKKLAYLNTVFSFDEPIPISLYDIETGKETTATLDCEYVADLKFIDNDHLCAITNDDYFFSSMEYSDEFTYVREGILSYYCFDKNMKQLWSSDLEYNDVAKGYNVFNLPERNAVVCFTGNSASIVDLDSGKELVDYTFGSSIVTTSDWNGNGLPEFICSNGDWIITADNNSNEYGRYSVLGQDLSFGIGGEFIYVVERNGCDIICYSRFLEDDEWEAIDGFSGIDAGSTYQAAYADEDYLIIAATTRDDTIKVSIIDAAKGKLIKQIEVPDSDYLASTFEVIHSGENYYGIFGENIYKINPKKGSVDAIDLTVNRMSEVSNGKIITYNHNGDDIDVEVTDIDGPHSTMFTIEGVNDIPKNMIYNETLNKVFVTVNQQLFVADLNSSKVKEIKIPDTFISKSVYTLYIETSLDGSMVVFSDGQSVIVTDDTFKTLYTLNCQAYYRFGACFKNGVLYIVEDNYLSMFKGDTGEAIGMYELTLYGVGRAEMTFNDTSNQLYVKTGPHICILDMETWQEIANIENAYCYNELNDRFYVYAYISDYETTPGYIKHYTLNDLIEKARRYLGNQEIDDVTKYKYGL